MMAKGTYATIILATSDLDGAFERVQASGAEIVQEPTDQPWGIRDFALRDPAGNMIRINELRLTDRSRASREDELQHDPVTARAACRRQPRPDPRRTARA